MRVTLRRRLSTLCLLSAAPVIMGFYPFTEVVNVCPHCPAAGEDALVLSSGEWIRGRIVAQNEDYFVISRHGEHRTVRRSDVQRLHIRTGGGPESLGTGDQIFLKNGTVLHGSIIEESVGRYFVIRVGPRQHVVWKRLIQRLYKGGRHCPADEGLKR